MCAVHRREFYVAARLFRLNNQAQSEYKHSLIFRVRAMFHSNKTRAPIANPLNSAQLEGTPTIPQVTSGSVQ